MESRVECNIQVSATRYGHAFAILIPKAVIPEHERSEILEIWVLRRSDPVREYTLYTTHLPGYDRAYLDVYQLGASYREEFVVKSVGKYSMEKFAKEYNSRKPKGLENTDLIWNGKLMMRINGVEVDLRGAKLRAYQGQVIADGQLGKAGPVKIAKSLDGFVVRLKDHSPVTGIDSSYGGTAMTYTRTGHDASAHRRMVIPPPAVDKQVVLRTEVSGLTFSVLQKPSHGKGRYAIHADKATISNVIEILGAARTPDEYKQAKGDIAEELVRQALTDLGMMLIADHPRNLHAWLRGSARTGPDLLIRLMASSDLHYVEIKWWEDADNAYAKAETQVIHDLERYPEYGDEKITAGSVAILEWKPRSDKITLYVNKASKS